MYSVRIAVEQDTTSKTAVSRAVVLMARVVVAKARVRAKVVTSHFRSFRHTACLLQIIGKAKEKAMEANLAESAKEENLSRATVASVIAGPTKLQIAVRLGQFSVRPKAKARQAAKVKERVSTTLPKKQNG